MKITVSERNFSVYKDEIGKLSRNYLESFEKTIDLKNQTNQWILISQENRHISAGAAVVRLLNAQALLKHMGHKEKAFFNQFPWFHNQSEFMVVTDFIPPQSGDDISAMTFEYYLEDHYRSMFDLLMNLSIILNQDRVLVLSKEWGLNDAGERGLWPSVTSCDEDEDPMQYVYGFVELNSVTYQKFADRWDALDKMEMTA